MLAITVTLTHGVMRAGSADDVALAGDGADAEWPPSPARLFSALVAGGGTGDGVPASVGVRGLVKLEGQVPDVYASAPSDTLVSQIRDRYVVIDDRASGTVQEYPARIAQKVSPGARVSPRDPRVVFVWPDIELDVAEMAALRFRAARVSYIGCSDSPAAVTVSDRAEVDLPRWMPDPGGTVSLPVPPLGFLDQLDDQFERWRAGAVIRRGWLRTPMCRYRTPDQSLPVAPEPVTIWLRFDRALGQQQWAAVAATLRAAVLTHVDRIAGGRDGVPEVIHGHLTQRGQGRQSARWLPLATVGSQHADGKIRGACVWLPAATDPATVELVRCAVDQIEVLAAGQLFSVRVRPFDGTDRPRGTHPRRWIGPATQWSSVTPVVHERHLHRPLQLDDVARWCANAGVPAPRAFRESPVPLLEGSRPFRADHLSGRSRFQGQRSYLELWFDEPVRGPVVIGKGRGFGVGLFAPVRGGHRDG